MSEYLIQGETLTDLAESLRSLDESTKRMSPGGMIDSIYGLQNYLVELYDRLMDFEGEIGARKLGILAPEATVSLSRQTRTNANIIYVRPDLGGNPRSQRFTGSSITLEVPVGSILFLYRFSTIISSSGVNVVYDNKLTPASSVVILQVISDTAYVNC